MKLMLGTAQFGSRYGVSNVNGQVTAQEVNIILQNARLFGIDSLDTAISYGDSETVLGRLGIPGWKAVTKLPAVPTDCDNVMLWVIEQIERSLKRLHISKLYGVLLHRPSDLLGRGGHSLLLALEEIKARGMASKIGFSVYSPAELSKLFDFCVPDLVQAPVNILDRSLVESGWANRLRDAGIEVHGRSAFLQGLLLMTPNQRPDKFNNRWPDVWDVWDRWLERSGLTPLQACLRYVCSLPGIDRIIVGVEAANQLNQIMEATKGHLDNLPEFNTFQDQRLINPTFWNEL